MLYVNDPTGVKKNEIQCDPCDYVFKKELNMCRPDQAKRIMCLWNKLLVGKLVNKLGCRQSKVDECVIFQGETSFVLYTDDRLFAGWLK